VAASVTRLLRSLDDLTELVEQHARTLYVRWSEDIDADLECEVSRDELTGVELPGLSANGLAVEQWWADRPRPLWIARRLYDYRHLRHKRGPGTRPWVLTGDECGRGPDNEPLLRHCDLIAEVDHGVVDEASRAIDELPADWGGLQRT
jgi:hypothetical protein